MRLFEWGNAHVTTINTKSGRIIKAVSREEEKSTLMERSYVEHANGGKKVCRIENR